MDLSKISLNLVRYLITKCEVSSPNLKSNYVVPVSAVTSIEIENDYENYNFPYFTISLELPAFVIRAIRKSPLKNYLFLSLQAGFYDSLDGNGLMEPKNTSTYLNDKYIMFIENQNRSLYDSEIEDSEEKEGYSYKSTDPKSNEVVKFSLYKEADIDASMKNINAIITSGCLIDILTYVLNSAGISNVLISPPGNYRSYSQLPLPPYSAMDHIERLCNDYGLHKNGTLIFFGLERKYIIEKDTRCTAYSTNEFKTTYIFHPSNGTQSALSAGCAKSANEKVNYIMLQPESSSFKDNSQSMKWSVGTNINVIGSDAVSVTSGNAGSGRFFTQKVGGNNSGGVKRDIDSHNKIASLGFRNCDLMMLTPNKTFVVTIEDQKYKQYNGNYRLTKSVVKFMKEGDVYTPFVQCEFRS